MIIHIVLAFALAAPGYDAFEKRELWETAERWRAKHDTAILALHGCEEKLLTRTTTVINQIAIPAQENIRQNNIQSEMLIAGAIGLVIGGALVFFAKNSTPGTLVIR